MTFPVDADVVYITFVFLFLFYTQRLKDEAGNRVIQTVVAVRPKVYSYRTVEHPASLLSTPASRDAIVIDELPPTPPPLVIVEDDDDTRMSIEETGDVPIVVDDDLLGATASLPEASTTMMPPLAYKDTCKAKGISRSTIAREIDFDNYKRSIDTLQPQRHNVRSIRSEDHTMYLQETSKSSLVVSDSKRFWLNRYQSLSFGNPLTKCFTSSESAEEEEQVD